jgi:hypothetical protein
MSSRQSLATAFPIALEAAVEMREQRRAKIALAPRTVQNIPDCFSRELFVGSGVIEAGCKTVIEDTRPSPPVD